MLATLYCFNCTFYYIPFYWLTFNFYNSKSFFQKLIFPASILSTKWLGMNTFYLHSKTLYLSTFYFLNYVLKLAKCNFLLFQSKIGIFYKPKILLPYVASIISLVFYFIIIHKIFQIVIVIFTLYKMKKRFRATYKSSTILSWCRIEFYPIILFTSFTWQLFNTFKANLYGISCRLPSKYLSPRLNMILPSILKTRIHSEKILIKLSMY